MLDDNRFIPSVLTPEVKMLTGRKSLSPESLGASGQFSLEGSSEKATRYMGSTLSYIPMVARQTKCERIGGMVDLGPVGSWYDRPLGSAAVTKAQSFGVPCSTVWWVGSLSWYGVSASSASLTHVEGNAVFELYGVTT